MNEMHSPNLITNLIPHDMLLFKSVKDIKGEEKLRSKGKRRQGDITPKHSVDFIGSWARKLVKF